MLFMKSSHFPHCTFHEFIICILLGKRELDKWSNGIHVNSAFPTWLIRWCLLVYILSTKHTDNLCTGICKIHISKL